MLWPIVLVALGCIGSRFSGTRILEARYVVSSSTSRNESRERGERGRITAYGMHSIDAERELSLSTRRRRQKNTWERVSVSVGKIMRSRFQWNSLLFVSEIFFASI